MPAQRTGYAATGSAREGTAQGEVDEGRRLGKAKGSRLPAADHSTHNIVIPPTDRAGKADS